MEGETIEETIGCLMKYGCFDLQYRRIHRGWDGPWRARLRPLRNSQKHLRVESFGSSAAEAISNLIGKAIATRLCQ